MRPTDDRLRGFLLGTLPADEADTVARWVEATPDAADALARLDPSDPLDAALAATPFAADPDTAGHFTRLADTAPHTPPPPLPAGYRFVRELGRGGMGVVLEAEDERLGRRVAVKVMRADVAARPEAKERFLREARALAAVESEFVVPIYHVGETADGAPFLVMPKLAGETLDARLARGPLTAGELQRAAGDAAAGLAAAHAKGLIHRDVKPSNLWLEPAADGSLRRVRVLDFGLARPVNEGTTLTATHQLIGTPAYMSPEQARSEPLTPATDLFSLGAALYRAATGRRPFAGDTPTAVLTALAVDTPAPVRAVAPDVPAAVARLIDDLLTKDPARRPTAADIARRLGGPPSPRPHPRRPLVVAGVVAVLALAAVTTWFATKPTPVSQPTPDVSTPAYTGSVDVWVERTVGGRPALLRLNEAGALPLRIDDKFRVEFVVDPPAYVYALWVDADHEVTPFYPWDPREDWGPRPAVETPVGRVSLPADPSQRYTIAVAKPGVSTVVLFARPTPLGVPDTEIRRWFESLPDLPVPPGGEGGAVWFDDYQETKNPLRLRTFGVVESADPFARWQGELKKALGPVAPFQRAVSFARTSAAC